MKIALIGHGKTGKEIEKIALEKGHEIVLIVTTENRNKMTASNLKQADVAIEFTNADSVVENLNLCLNATIPVVCGTTGWNEKYNEVKNSFIEKNGTIFTASNFSVGVNLFFKLNKFLATLMNEQKDYNILMEEIHHSNKKDYPSGTALTLAKDITSENKNITNTETFLNVENITAENNILKINAIREDEVPGTHEIIYTSAIDSISIKHTANNRRGFAAGAVLAAEWVQHKKGIFTMYDLMNSLEKN